MNSKTDIKAAQVHCVLTAAVVDSVIVTEYSVG
jgi:hypothetical protein